MSWCGGGEINVTPGVAWRSRAMNSVTLKPGGWRRVAGSAGVCRDEEDVGTLLGYTVRNRADARRSDQLHAHARLRGDLLEDIDELREILERIDVVVRRR